MFGRKKNRASQSRIESLVGVGTRIDGDVIFSGGLRIDGEVHGNITCANNLEGTLVISEKATVEGAITVGHVVINGVVIGSVSAQESLELLPAARVTGDIEYQQIEMQQGAVVQGRMIHQLDAAAVELKLAANG
ncbi:MAG: polymer-forming cytoskeletal protein [Propionivibrio sp.]